MVWRLNSSERTFLHEEDMLSPYWEIQKLCRANGLEFEHYFNKFLEYLSAEFVSDYKKFGESATNRRYAMSRVADCLDSTLYDIWAAIKSNQEAESTGDET